MDNTATTAPEKTAAPKQKTRIAQMMLPQLDPNSALLPPDKWIIDTSWAFVRDNKSFHRAAAGVLGFGTGAVATVITGIVAAFAVTGLAPVLGVAALTLGIAGLFAKKTHDSVKKFKTETFQELRMEVGKKYLEYKMSELKSAWDKKRAELAAKKKAEAEAKAAAPKIETTVDVPPAKPLPVPANDVKPADPKKDIGGWLLKTALDQANKKKAAGTSAASADPKPKNDTPKP